jgi:hypothetical protein
MLDGVGGQRHAPAAFPPGKTRYPLFRRLGGPQGWSGRVRKISPPPGFDPLTAQPVASRYTDWAIPARSIIIVAIIIIINEIPRVIHSLMLYTHTSLSLCLSFTIARSPDSCVTASALICESVIVRPLRNVWQNTKLAEQLDALTALKNCIGRFPVQIMIGTLAELTDFPWFLLVTAGKCLDSSWIWPQLNRHTSISYHLRCGKVRMFVSICVVYLDVS